MSALGQGVKETAAQSGTAAQTHLSAIQSSGATILQHGQNALAALKDALTDILRKITYHHTCNLNTNVS